LGEYKRNVLLYIVFTYVKHASMYNMHPYFWIRKVKGRDLLLGIPRCRVEDNIKVDLKETGFQVLGCIHLAHCRLQWQDLVNTVNGPSYSMKDKKFLYCLNDS
jgi:hypothetical protein